MKNVSVIITAGGLGRRLNAEIPKQFLKLNGVPIIERSLAAFDPLDVVSEIILVLPKGYTHWPIKCKKAAAVISGGSERQHSVYKALQAVSPLSDIVLIHDGVRPFVSERLIQEVISAASDGYVAVAGVRATDTIKETDSEGWVINTPNRAALWNVQTPQGFPYKIIKQAHERALEEGYIGTDDSMLVERYQLAKVKMIEGERTNIKITTPEDIMYSEAVLHT